MLKCLLALFLVAIAITSSACSQTPSQSTPTPTPTLAPNEFDPSEMLNDLRQVSKPFADFYDAEVAPFNNTIRWFLDPSLTTEFPAATYVTDNNCVAYVFLLQKPPFERDVYTIAHELAAVVVCNTGFQENWTLECQYEDINGMNVKGMLVNMIYIPVRDVILTDYGFNLEDYYLSIVQSLPTLPCKEPMDAMKIHMCAWDYVWLTLYWRDVLGNHNESTDLDLDNVFQENQIDAWEEGSEILAKVNDIGYNTSDKVKVLFQWIVDKYDLECAIK